MKNHILIIDDEWINRELYKEFLIPYGYRVSMAKDGEEGLEMAFTSEPDIILLDIRLPKISGCKIYELLKNDSATKDIPILVISALYSKANIKNECTLIPQKDIYIKPLHHKEIKERIDVILGRGTKKVMVKTNG